ncbi:MAG: aspartate kinase [Chlorobi bacterium]|nr:aspartate kinase [Chlorobiota bacterium]
MIVYKFGGASVKTSKAVIRVSEIIKKSSDDIILVVSAMGKMTNAFEELVSAYYFRNKQIESRLKYIIDFHRSICDELFENFANGSVYHKISFITNKLKKCLTEKPTANYDYEYDKIVAFGELYSSTIVSEYLNSIGLTNTWIDIRLVIKTDDNFREARVNFKISEKLALNNFIENSETHNKAHKIFVTQGFIASTISNNSSTLGREGSDYTAALLGSFLNASKVIVWKDVPGIMSADPKWFKNAEVIHYLSYKEAIELAFYGAKVIHPKTIKPLQNKNLVMEVKSFDSTENSGTLISSETELYEKPIFILKTGQILISIANRDFSFIVENSFSLIFKIFAKNKVKINTMQNSAISFTVCCNYDEIRINSLIQELRKGFKVLYNKDVYLITIRNYTKKILSSMLEGKNILLEQKSRNTAQVVYKEKEKK